jgi:hypothetical protein
MCPIAIGLAYSPSSIVNVNVNVKHIPIMTSVTTTTTTTISCDEVVRDEVEVHVERAVREFDAELQRKHFTILHTFERVRSHTLHTYIHKYTCTCTCTCALKLFMR